MAAGDAPAPDGGGEGALRLDKWLWHARFARTRSLAARLVTETGVRINGQRTGKPAAQVRAGDVLTFALGAGVRVVRVQALGVRRGPAPEAQALYEDLAPPEPRARPSDPAGPDASGLAPPARRDAGAGRPEKAARRALDRLRPDPFD